MSDATWLTSRRRANTRQAPTCWPRRVCPPCSRDRALIGRAAPHASRTILAVVFETARLRVREYTAEDAAFVFDMYSRPVVVQYLGAAPKPLESLDQARQIIERWRAVSSPNPLLGVWAVTLRDSGQ